MILSSTTRQNDPLSPREFQRIKTSIHEELVESLDLAAVGLIDDQQMRSEVKDLGHAIYKQRRLKLSQDDKGKLQWRAWRGTGGGWGAVQRAWGESRRRASKHGHRRW